MSTLIAYPHIIKSGTESAKLQRIPRVRVAQIVADYLAHGWSPEEMCRQHPDLMLSEAYSAMAYYFDNSQEIDAELQAELEQSNQSRQISPVTPLLVRLRATGRI